MQRNRFETYRGRLRFKPNYRLCAVKGSIVVRKVTRGSLDVN